MPTVLHLRQPRCGRSAALFTFDRQPLAAPIQSVLPYSFEDALVLQNDIILWREDFDPVYRGEVAPHESCAQVIDRHPWDRTDGEEDEVADTETVPTTPEPEPSSPVEHADSSPATPEPGASSPFERASSPLTPLPPSREVSPTLTDVANGWRPNLKTYSKRDRKRFLAERQSKAAQAKAEAQAKAAAIKHAKAAALAKRRRRYGRPTHHSARLLRYRTDPLFPEVWNADKLVAHGHIIHAMDPDATTPLIDNKGYVTAVIAGPPKDQKRLWVHVMQHADKAMRRVYRNTVFPNLGDKESRVRFGVGFGDLGVRPSQISVPDAQLDDITFIKTSETFQMISAYQNHSVFTTTEIAFGDGPQLSRKNCEAKFDTMEAVTVGGTYAWEEGRPLLVFWDDFAVFPSGLGQLCYIQRGQSASRSSGLRLTSRSIFSGSTATPGFCVGSRRISGQTTSLRPRHRTKSGTTTGSNAKIAPGKG
ncbi:hypothetical protein B0H11DRAFT_1942472 [Mycena galericulata]|nr:hypothetical protein B0H11DRAFT_1942472 [Mycena galericulata]